MRIISIGEPLMEFSEQGNQTYLAGYGGDTSNFLIAAARQGGEASYLTKVGDDAFGREFLELWKKENVDTNNVQVDPKAHTGLYFISYSKNGHEFTYHREGSAASMLSVNDIHQEIFTGAEYLHVSGISQAISDTSCDAVFRAIDYAKNENIKISYDPNFRAKLWGLTRAKSIINHTATLADIFLPSLEEAQKLTGLQDPDKILDYYLRLEVPFIALKLGKEGVYLAGQSFRKKVSGFTVNTLDSTGAGDTFDGAFIARLSKGDDYEMAAVYANAAAALSTTGHGAVNPIPTFKEVKDFLERQQ